MATQSEIISEVVRPMELAGYKVPQGDGDRAAFVSVYYRVLRGYTPKQLRVAMTGLLETAVYTPKPASVVKTIKDSGGSAAGVVLTENDDGYWPWVEYRCKEVGNLTARRSYEAGGKFYNKLYVPTPLPPEGGE